MAKKRELLAFDFSTFWCTENPQIQVVIFCCCFLTSLSKGQINKTNYLQKENFASEGSLVSQ